MEQKAAAGTTVDKLAAALNSIEAENPHLKEVLQAFRGILLEHALWKAELPIPDCPEINRPDPDRFEKGVPLTDREWFCRLGELWPTAAERMIPVMIAGFPKLQHELQQLQTAIQRRAFAPDLFLSALFGGRAAEAREHAEAAGFTSEVLEFALIQAAKPIIDKRAEAIAPLIEGLTWHKGYCPLCGSLPGLSLLKEKEGQRWLRCGYCTCTWRFHRTTCPFCDAQGPEDFELIFVDGREHERIEACHQCNKYLIEIDLRTLANEVVLEVAGIGLLHLDAIAQQQGFTPINSGGTLQAPSPDRIRQVS